MRTTKRNWTISDLLANGTAYDTASEAGVTGKRQMDVWPYALVGAGLLAVVVGLMRRRRKPSAAKMVFGFEPTKLPPHAPPVQRSTSPVDLNKPLGQAEWETLSRLRRDAGFQSALTSVRKRYELSADPMLAARTIAEVMGSKRVDIFEAIVLVARDRAHDAH